MRVRLAESTVWCQSSQLLCAETKPSAFTCFYSAGSEEHTPLFLEWSRCTQPAILMSLVWAGVYVRCFEMLEKFQTTLRKNKNKLMFFPRPSLLVQIFCEQVFSEKKHTYLTPLNASLNLLLIFLFLLQMLNLCLNHGTMIWFQCIQERVLDLEIFWCMNVLWDNVFSPKHKLCSSLEMYPPDYNFAFIFASLCFYRCVPYLGSIHRLCP